VVELEQGMDFALDVEQGMEGIDEMESSKSLPAVQGEGRRSFELALVRRRGVMAILSNPSTNLPLYSCLTREPLP
jgi:hypothetical protein